MNAQEKRLTEEQSAFAEKHHHVVMDFLRRKRLPESEFYDVVIFRYLRAVQLYCINPQLRRCKFEAIAFKAMDWQMKSYWRKAYKTLDKTLSLDSQLAGGGLTLHDVVPADDSDAGEAACDTLTAEALLAALSDEQHTLLGLRLDGYSVKEIAGRMGMSCAQVEDMISDSFANAIAHENQRSLMEYQLLKFALQSGILSVSENKGLSDEAMKAVVQQTVSAAPSENQTAALTENESVILSTFPDGYSFAGLDKVDEQGLVYTIENRSDAYWLVVTGKFTQSGKSVFLLNARNITPVIEEKQLMQKRFTTTFIIVICVSAAVMVGLSLFLTAPIISYKIDKIVLGYARVINKNSQDKYLLIPVWDFYGQRTIEFDHEYIDKQNAEYGQTSDYMLTESFDVQPLVTANALDGTIVDRTLGY